MKFVLIVIAMLAAPSLTLVGDSNAILTDCVHINVALLGQMCNAHSLLDAAPVDTLNATCQSLDGLFASVSKLLGGGSDGTLSAAVGLLGNVNVGSIVAASGAANVGVSLNLLESLVDLVANLVINLVESDCNVSSSAANLIKLTNDQVNALAKSNIGLNIKNSLLVNLNTGAYVALTADQLQALIILVNSLANASNPNVQAAINVNAAVGTGLKF